MKTEEPLQKICLEQKGPPESMLSMLKGGGGGGGGATYIFRVSVAFSKKDGLKDKSL